MIDVMDAYAVCVTRLGMRRAVTWAAQHRRRGWLFMGGAFLVSSVFAADAVTAREPYLQRLKLRLAMEQIRCVDCHVSSASEELNAYGREIARHGDKDAPFFDRWLEAEEPVSSIDDEAAQKKAKQRLDVDGDGVPNWVELLAGSSPAEKKSVPPQPEKERVTPMAERITEAIDCRLCHIRTDAPAGDGRSRAPHNAFGVELARLGELLEKRRLPRSTAEARGDTDYEPAPAHILARLAHLEKRDADHDGVRNWDEIRLYHHPAERDDRPDREKIRALRETAGRPFTKDEGLGPHALEAPFNRREIPRRNVPSTQ